ncbi:hypothetical protein [Streptosporangium sp. KLBMP 9127]|nr:hypothetical protein [Streptosporangium sp. KLBMP 9127]
MLGNILITGGASGLGRAAANAEGRPLVIDVNGLAGDGDHVDNVIVDLSDRAAEGDRAERYKPGPDARLNQPEDAAAVLALGQPPGCELRELVIRPSTETSWP